MQQAESPKAAPIKEEVAICSPGQGSRGAILGQKTAACLPDESWWTGRKYRVLVGTLRI
jgi:hypothetical protein